MLDKQIFVDQIELLPNGVIQVRQRISIVEDGKELSHSFHRWCVAPGDDISAQPEEVQKVAKATWTQAKVDSYRETVKLPAVTIAECELVEKTELATLRGAKIELPQ